MVNVAARVEKIEVFKRGWNFANRTYFTSCIMKKHYFLTWTKETKSKKWSYPGGENSIIFEKKR